MNNDEKQTETQASETQPEEVTQEAETSTETKSTDLDYQKELEMARKELEKKNKRITQAEHVIEKLKTEGASVNTETIEAIVDRLVEDKVAKLTNQVRGDAIDTLINSYASSKDEAELIKFHLENSIKQSGDDVTDIINAKALANKARFTQQTAEIKRAKLETEANEVTSAGAKTETVKKIPLSEADKRIMRIYGITEEDLRKQK